MNTLLWIYIAIYFALESYEILWQKADSMMGMLLRMHRYYARSVVLFLLMHPTFYFVIFLVLEQGLSPLLGVILFVKTFDIATKIVLIEQVFIKRRLSQKMTLMLLTPLGNYLPYVPLLIYPPMLFVALYM